MRFEHFQLHQELNRRKLFAMGGAAAAFSTLGGLAAGGGAAAAPPHVGRDHDHDPEAPEPVDDSLFDPDAVEAGAWAPSRYGAGDERGTMNEITAITTARAMRLLNRGRRVQTFNLGERLYNGFPAFAATPPRVYQQRITAAGFPQPPNFLPATDWAEDHGSGLGNPDDPNNPELAPQSPKGFWSGGEASGPNRASVMEDRQPYGATYQIATQLDGLNHVGVGNTFYNGFKGDQIAKPEGTSALGGENVGPFATRAVLLDVLGLKISTGATSALTTYAGETIIVDSYRITVDDLQACMRRARIRSIEPGDVVLLRTGWRHVAPERERYVSVEPGIYVAEAKWLAKFRPAVIGGDAPALEVLGNPVVQAAFPVHQFLLAKYGIRIGEGIVLDELADNGVNEFVYVYNPQFANGTTAGNTPPIALATVR